ncbi:UNVERIFIED_CONTAM: hypothetical protein RMT77_003001 [Armadillidium vulgare]
MIIAAVIVAVSLISNIVAEIPHNSYKPPPIPYQFSYGVSDPYGGTDFSQDENSDGNLVQGTYTVQLPDGRRQIVTYEADHDRGYVAKVHYEGQAQYPSKGAPAITFPPQVQVYPH